MGLSRPVLKTLSKKGAGSHPKTAVAIIIDNSYSMDYLVDTQTDLEKGKEICKEVNEYLTQNDAVVLISRDAKWNSVNSYISYGKLKKNLISSIKITPNPLSLKTVFDAAQNYLKESQYINSEIYFITDFQKEKWPKNVNKPVVIIKTSDLKYKKNISCYESFVTSQLVTDKRKKTIHFKIENYFDKPVSDIICKLVIDNKTKAEKIVNLAPFQKKEEKFEVSFQNNGWYSGYIKVKDERLRYDNKNYFSFFVKDNPKVALITSEKKFPASLVSILEIYSDDIKELKGSEVSEKIFDYYDNIIVYKAEYSDKLADILSNGKILFIADKNDSEKWIKFYQKTFKTKFDGFYDEPQNKMVNSQNNYNPITKILKNDNNTEINLFYKTKNTTSSILLKAQNYPIAFQEDNNILWLFSIDMENPFMISSMFPPFAYNCLMASGNMNLFKTSYKTGDKINTPYKHIILPNQGYIDIRKPYFVADNAGIYNAVKHIYAVNNNFEESNYRQMNKKDISLNDFTLTYNNWKAHIFKNRYGNDIWKYFFLIALILFIIEMILVKMEEKQ